MLAFWWNNHWRFFNRFISFLTVKKQISWISNNQKDCTSVWLYLLSLASKSSSLSRKNQSLKGGFSLSWVLLGSGFGGGLTSNLSSNSCSGISNFLWSPCNLFNFFWWRISFFSLDVLSLLSSSEFLKAFRPVCVWDWMFLRLGTKNVFYKYSVNVNAIICRNYTKKILLIKRQLF